MYNQYGSAQQPLADEIAISNMLKALSTPQIVRELSEEEQKEILQAIKNHILVNAKIVNNVVENKYHR